MKKRKSTQAREIFSSNLRWHRLDKSLTQEQLAEKSGLHPNYVGSVERGERNVSIDNMQKLSEALGVDLPELLTEVHRK
jgi:transcriptional regulator with XRE-family HTH domain